MNNQVIEISPLASPYMLSIKNIEEIAASPVLIVAPHPDDETLGCGGAIALLRAINCDVRVLIVTDGTLSHPNSKKYPAPELKALRKQETLTALNMLGVENKSVTFLGLQDGSVAAQYKSFTDSCRMYLAGLKPQVIFLPWRQDPHPDHSATWKLIYEATNVLKKPRIIEYPIWDWDPSQRGNFRLDVQCWRLDISKMLRLKEKAISVYRSQTTNLIDDDPEAFILTSEMLSNFTHPWEMYIEAKI
jgi:LmbE family N-acetylglucosaminyl deacetylase